MMKKMVYPLYIMKMEILTGQFIWKMERVMGDTPNIMRMDRLKKHTCAKMVTKFDLRFKTKLDTIISNKSH